LKLDIQEVSEEFKEGSRIKSIFNQSPERTSVKNTINRRSMAEIEEQEILDSVDPYDSKLPIF
jgi:hypothetical protein